MILLRQCHIVDPSPHIFKINLKNEPQFLLTNTVRENKFTLDAEVAELVDAADSKSAVPQGHGGSTPPFGSSA